MKASVVFREIVSYIKGSAQALDSPGGRLSREEYLLLGRKVIAKPHPIRSRRPHLSPRHAEQSTSRRSFCSAATTLSPSLRGRTIVRESLICKRRKQQGRAGLGIRLLPQVRGVEASTRRLRRDGRVLLHIPGLVCGGRLWKGYNWPVGWAEGT